MREYNWFTITQYRYLLWHLLMTSRKFEVNILLLLFSPLHLFFVFLWSTEIANKSQNNNSTLREHEQKHIKNNNTNKQTQAAGRGQGWKG